MSSDQALGRWQASMGIDAQQPPVKPVLNPDLTLQAGAPLARGATSVMGLGMKTILLVDSNLRSRESRAKILRTFGVHVDCAENAGAALVRLAADKYNLVLVDLGRDVDSAESLVQKIKTNNSRQLVGFLVGSPLFVAKSLNGSTLRTRRGPGPAMVAAADEPKAAAVGGIDFGQRIRDAEAEEPVG